MLKNEFEQMKLASEKIMVEAQKLELSLLKSILISQEGEMNPEDLTRLAIYQEVLNHAVTMGHLFNKTSASVLVEGKLIQNINGHYTIQGVEVRKGTYVEYWVPESQNGPTGYYQPAEINCDLNGYFMLDSRGNRVKLDGQLVRLK